MNQYSIAENLADININLDETYDVYYQLLQQLKNNIQIIDIKHIYVVNCIEKFPKIFNNTQTIISDLTKCVKIADLIILHATIFRKIFQNYQDISNRGDKLLNSNGKHIKNHIYRNIAIKYNLELKKYIDWVVGIKGYGGYKHSTHRFCYILMKEFQSYRHIPDNKISYVDFHDRYITQKNLKNYLLDIRNKSYNKYKIKIINELSAMIYDCIGDIHETQVFHEHNKYTSGNIALVENKKVNEYIDKLIDYINTKLKKKEYDALIAKEFNTYDDPIKRQNFIYNMIIKFYQNLYIIDQ